GRTSPRPSSRSSRASAPSRCAASATPWSNDMDIIATLGPSLLTSARINSFIDEGVTIFRVNGAHTDAHMVASIVEKVRRFAGGRARIMVDLPTNKVRVMNISEPIVFGAGDTF